MNVNERKIRVLIVDDEPHARRAIQVLLKDEAGVEIVGECGDGPSTLKALPALRPDLVFLDVQMPEMSGLEVLKRTAPEDMPPAIIFVTAYDEYAINAFDVHAVDYLLKPFDDERFAKALERARQHLWRDEVVAASRRLFELVENFEQGEAQTSGGDEYLQRIAIRSTGRTTLVKVEDLDWVEASDQYVTLHARGRCHLARDSMTRLENELDPRRFRRIHRSALVNLERVKEIRPQQYGDAIIVLDDGTNLRLSRSRREEFESALMHYSRRS